MLTPALPEQLAALAAEIGNTRPAPPEQAVDAAQIHDKYTNGTCTSDHFARHLHKALLPLLARLLATESDLAAMRTTVARHAAAANQGDDLVPDDLLRALRRVGIDLDSEVDAAAAVLDAEARASARG